jgi:hypothetical protein
LASHVNAVFVLARHFGIETDWDWATGAPVGILRHAWDIRLLPHYSLAVFLVLAHLSCGLRAILNAHGVPAARAIGVALVVGSAALIVSSQRMIEHWSQKATRAWIQLDRPLRRTN